MNKMFWKFINSLSSYEFDMKKNYKGYRKMQDKISIKKKSKEIIKDNILFRIFVPKKVISSKIIIYIHGGGFSTGNTKNYSYFLNKLANYLDRTVIAIEYRLAPEYKFPIGFNDCYKGVEIIYENAKIFNVSLTDTIIMGDSAGANIATGVCIKAKKEKKFKISKEILLYPIVQTNFKDNKRFKSIEENGYKYILTKKIINDYLELYLNDINDYKNIYVAPYYCNNLFFMPKTLIVTADLDPLRDEGYAYYKKLKIFFNKCEYYNMKNVIHGYINIPLFHKEVKKTLDIIKKFGSD